MEVQRVVRVRGPVAPGSGYVLSGRLVLTSAHVVGDVASVVGVQRLTDVAVYTATVAWRGAPSGRDDAALLLVTDNRWPSLPDVPVRWGRTVTYQPGIEVVTWGFPDVAQRPDQPPEVMQPSGTLNPGDRYVGDRYVLNLAQFPPEWDRRGSSPWGGLSGAALFCDDLLCGVIAADPASSAHARLEAVPAYVLHHDTAFRAVLRQHGGVSMPLEPIEWQHLVDEGADRTNGQMGAAARSPAGLLVAARGVVPFRGREDLLWQMRAWARRPGLGVWLVHGAGGQGKTRLAYELAGALIKQRWQVLWLDHRRFAATELSVLAHAAVPTLIVVDYAETRLD